MNFLDRLTEVVDECIERDVAPIISWIHHAAEAKANETDRQNYIDWWTRVAEKLKDRNYHLSLPSWELTIAQKTAKIEKVKNVLEVYEEIQ